MQYHRVKINESVLEGKEDKAIGGLGSGKHQEWWLQSQVGLSWNLTLGFLLATAKRKPWDSWHSSNKNSPVTQGKHSFLQCRDVTGTGESATLWIASTCQEPFRTISYNFLRVSLSSWTSSSLPGNLVAPPHSLSLDLTMWLSLINRMKTDMMQAGDLHGFVQLDVLSRISAIIMRRTRPD